jgi:hypothetical protein
MCERVLVAMVNMGNSKVQWRYQYDLVGREFGQQMQWDNAGSEENFLSEWALEESQLAYSILRESRIALTMTRFRQPIQLPKVSPMVVPRVQLRHAP